MKPTKRDLIYIANSQSVKQVCKRFNVELHSCNPDWRLVGHFPFSHTFEVSDDFMGKLATLFGFQWKWNEGTGLDEVWGNIASVNETTKYHREGLKRLEKNLMKIDKKSLAGMIKGQKEKLKYQEQLLSKLRTEIKVLETLKASVLKKELMKK
jgi:hypothetical protein